MNPKDLAKHYDQLTARERLPLIIAASARSDAVESKRLLDSAPRICFQVPHHYGLAEALNTAANYHLMTLLDLAAKYWQWWGLWGWHCFCGESDKDQGRVPGKRAAAVAKTEELRLFCLARYHAFLFVTHVDGWKQFCSDLLIDAEMLLNVKPGWEMAARTEAKARAHAFPRDDAMMFMLGEAIDVQGVESEDLKIPPVPTVEGLAKEWRGIVDRRAEALSG